MRTGDKLNNYKNDVIDGYEKERQTEHRGEMLHGYPAYGDDGIFDESILITRMELANGLTFKSNINSSSFDVDKFFEDYGGYNQDNKVKALRVWSGNDHWLLTKESANKYLKILPLNTTVSSTTFFNLVYFTGTDDELKELVNEQKLDAVALLFHNGTTSGGGGVTESEGILFTEPLQEKPEEMDDWVQVLMNSDNSVENSPSNSTIQFPQSWENINYVYLVTAPIHQKFAPADDSLKIPLYGGTLRFVFKDKTTFDLTTRSSMSYFYTLQELREYNMPEVENPITTNPFDWEASGYGGIRHVPLVVVNPENESQRKRVLDSFDSNVTSEERDAYTIVVNSKSMFEPTLQDGFKILSYPKKMDLSYMDHSINIEGMRVALVQAGSPTQYFSYEDGTLFIDTPEIYDHELCIGNLGNTIERIVYAQKDEDSEKYKVMNIKFPVVEATPEEVLAYTQVAIPTITSDESPEEKEADVGQLVASIQVSLGGSEVDDLPEDTMFPLLLGSKKGIFSSIKRFFSNAWGKIKKHGKDVAKDLLDKGKSELKKQFDPQKLLDAGREVLKEALSNENFLEDTNSQVMLTGTSRVLLTSCLVPPLSATQKQLIVQKNGSRLTWGEIFKEFDRIKHYFVKGVAVLKKTLTKVSDNSHVTSTRRGSSITLKSTNSSNIRDYKPAIIKETHTWVVNESVKPQCEDMLMSGLNVDSTEDTQTVKIFTGGQQQTVVLHHPQAVTNGSLIGIRMRKPPVSDTVNYGEATGDQNLQGAEFIAVDSNNNDVKLTGSNMLDGTPYLTVSNGGIIGKRVKWSPSMASGQADMEVVSTTSGINAYLQQGHVVSEHIVKLYQRKGAQTLLQGIATLFTKARKFFQSPSKVAETLKKGISQLSKMWMKDSPKLLSKKVIVKDTNETEVLAFPDEEPPVVIDSSSEIGLTSTVSIDSQVDDNITETCEAILFDKNFPTENAITLENLQEYFRGSSVAILDENDEELTGEVGSGLSRNYIAKGQVDVGATLCRDLLEFGTARLSWNGIMFEIGSKASENDPNPFLNPLNYNYELVLIKAPEKTVYVYGDQSVDLTGASWNLVDLDSGKIIIESLTMKNVICEPLPNNIEQVQLEVPEDDKKKTPIEVSFLGFRNQEIRVTILAPFIKGLEELNTDGEVSEEVTNGTLAIASNLCPMRLNMQNVVSGVTETNSSVAWPKTTYELLIKLNANLILQDNALHQKSFPVSEMSETLANKIFSVDYDPNIDEDIQEVKISGMGYCTKQWISRAKVGYAIEDDMVEGEISEENVYDTTPEDWDGTTPENGGGQTTAMIPDVESMFMKSVYHRAVSRSPIKHRELQGTVLTSLDQLNKVLGKSSIYSSGYTGIGSIFKNTVTGLNILMNQSTGLKHHEVSGFFKKLWNGVKKVGKKIGSTVVDIARKVGTTIYDAGKYVIKEHGKEILNAATQAGISALGKVALATNNTSITMENAIRVYDGVTENGVLKFKYVPTNSINSDDINSIKHDLPLRGIRAFPIKGKKKLAYVFSSNRRLLAGFHHRNPSTTPGMGLIGLYRRYPEVYPSKYANSEVIQEEDTKFDVIEDVPLSTYEEETILGDKTYNFDNIVIYPNSLSFSTQDLILGDYWPSLEEMKELVHLYVQRKTDQVWISVPLSHENIEIDNYSNIDTELQQIIEVHFKIDTQMYDTYCILSLNGSQLSPVDSNTEGYAWFYTLPEASNLDTVLLTYISPRRYNKVQQNSDGSFEDVNGKEADEQKYVIFENRHIKSLYDVHEYSSSVEWNTEEISSTVGILTCRYTRDVHIEDSVVEPYHFNYLIYSVDKEGIMQIKKYGEEKNIYVNKDDILFYYDEENNSLTIVGYVPGTTKKEADIGMFSEIVSEFK